ncbi:MAG: TonB-dependent receptor [Woeseia sp.]
MKVDEIRVSLARLLGLSILSFAFAIAAPTSFAQDIGEEDEDIAEEDSAEDDSAMDEVTVTGSRLKRSTYSSIAPLQVITSQVSREVGLIDASDILQESSAATGQQIDLTFSGFVVEEGPGTSPISLRGLGSARTLVLVNGRRLAPAGVEGAPFAADLNLVPDSLVQQYDLLLDGASSVYGSDAVAGVVNVILRKDFDGLEIESYTTVPEQSEGVQHNVSAVWGQNFDRGFIGVGVQAESAEIVTAADRRWTNQCDKHYEVTTTGEFRTTGVADQFVQGMQPNDCKSAILAGRIIPFPFGSVYGSWGSIYYTPGAGNSGLADWSENYIFSTPVDADGDGQIDIDFADYALESRSLNRTLSPEFDSLSVLAYGEYTFAGEANITPYFEAMYNEREVFFDGGRYQLFPVVPANNPYNPCNPDGLNGVDCGPAFDALMNNPNYAADFEAVQGVPPTSIPPLGNYGNVGAVPVQIVSSVIGDRTENDNTVEQTRIVAGVRGDIPALSFGSLENWSFDVAAVWARSDGVSSRPGIRNDLMLASLSTSAVDGTGNVVCGDDADGDGTPDGVFSDPARTTIPSGTACVPLNLFAPSLYANVVGDFATQAERDYVFDSRDFSTIYEQAIYSAFITGDVFEMPAGPVSAGLGIEHRIDEIKSIPDEVAAQGLLFGFFSDQGAVGQKDTSEAYGELEFPLLVDVPLATELTLNTSARWTQDEYYGTAWTYAGKLGYRPVPSLLLRATYGTSYRAPNLRENFLLGQTGFLTLADPCVVPAAAYNTITGYNPSQDNRDPNILQNCVTIGGVDPQSLGAGTLGAYSVENSAGGALDLLEETSDSLSLGFAFEQPWFNRFDMTLGATFYRIEIEDSIIEPSSQFIVNDCYTSPVSVRSTFCDRISRGPDGLLDFINAGFINRDSEKVEGVDVNIAFDMAVTMFERPVDIGADLVANRSLALDETFIDADGNVDFDSDQGEFGFPDWNGSLTLRADVAEWRVTWQTRYIGSVNQDIEFLDPFSNVDDGGSDTCLGPQNGDVNCRDVGFAENYFTHALSLYYYGDVWTFGAGIRNVLDQEPPMVDGNEITAINNTPLGYGYDVNGRTFYFNIAATFDVGL